MSGMTGSVESVSGSIIPDVRMESLPGSRVNQQVSVDRGVLSVRVSFYSESMKGNLRYKAERGTLRLAPVVSRSSVCVMKDGSWVKSKNEWDLINLLPVVAQEVERNLSQDTHISRLAARLALADADESIRKFDAAKAEAERASRSVEGCVSILSSLPESCKSVYPLGE